MCLPNLYDGFGSTSPSASRGNPGCAGALPENLNRGLRKRYRPVVEAAGMLIGVDLVEKSGYQYTEAESQVGERVERPEPA